MAIETTQVKLITVEAMLQYWQGHRRLTRKVIEAFPDDKLFAFSIGGMRPFGEMAMEIVGMGLPSVDGLLTGKWEHFQGSKAETKSELLSLWDAQTELLEEKFPKIPVDRFFEVDKAFGQWEMQGTALIQYVIDNEIHHRGEGYVYLRALGIEPPQFWDRN